MHLLLVTLLLYSMYWHKSYSKYRKIEISMALLLSFFPLAPQRGSQWWFSVKFQSSMKVNIFGDPVPGLTTHQNFISVLKQ